jgi:hypothetical protein
MFNLKSFPCPVCGKMQPRFRIPKIWRQFWLGGHTCSNCKTRMDKWGKALKGDR